MASAACTVARCMSARPASLTAPRRRSRVPSLKPVCSSSRVDLGGEPLQVVKDLAASDEVLRFFAANHDEQPHNQKKKKRLGDLMQTNLITASPEAGLDEVSYLLEEAHVEGLPVVDAAGKLVGVISKKDLSKGQGTLVKDVMSTKLVTLKPTDKATVAAHTMIDNKIHRVPITDDEGRCIGIVCRHDIFWALCDKNERAAVFHEHGIDL